MNESIHISEGVKERFTAYASLSGIGRQVVARHIFKPIEHYVKIAQKVVKYTPTAKLKDGFINILAGGTGMVEVNQRVRSDIGLQRAFGRRGCAEQSVIQDTLDACTEENVTQMQAALRVIYQNHSQGYRHDYDHRAGMAIAGCGYDRATVWTESRICDAGIFCASAQSPGSASRVCGSHMV